MPITEVLLTLFTIYHSPLFDLLLSWFEHNELVKLIGICDWMKSLMNYSFPLRLHQLSRFPTVDTGHCFRMLIQEIQETPEHHPDASHFLDLIWMSTCECWECEITSEFFLKALLFCETMPRVSKHTHC
jgi:hypothetical protein